MFVRTYAGAIVGSTPWVTVEVNIAGGGLGMYLVGLPDNAVEGERAHTCGVRELGGESGCPAARS